MTAENFNPSLRIILREEGGNDDDPRDHGGRTSRGIIQREWDVFRKTHPDRPEDVWKASDADIATIYREQYWNPYCDQLPAGIDLVFFNTAVNSGRQQAVKELQRALGIGADGMMGMLTLQAVKDCPDTYALVHKLAERRRDFYRALRQFPIYGKGWMARTDRVEAAALKMAKAQPAATVAANYQTVDTLPKQPKVTVSAKAVPTDTAAPPLSQEKSVAVTTGTSAGTAILQQVQDAAGQLSPYADTIKYVKYVLIALAVVGLALTVWAIWHNSKTKEAVG